MNITPFATIFTVYDIDETGSLVPQDGQSHPDVRASIYGLLMGLRQQCMRWWRGIPVSAALICNLDSLFSDELLCIIHYFYN
jgi:hypothetical protein